MNRLKFKTAGKLPIILEDSLEYTPILKKENWRMSTCNRLDLQTLGSSTGYDAQKSPRPLFCKWDQIALVWVQTIRELSMAYPYNNNRHTVIPIAHALMPTSEIASVNSAHGWFFTSGDQNG